LERRALVFNLHQVAKICHFKNSFYAINLLGHSATDCCGGQSEIWGSKGSLGYGQCDQASLNNLMIFFMLQRTWEQAMKATSLQAVGKLVSLDMCSLLLAFDYNCA
jgi:hypothetical protein